MPRQGKTSPLTDAINKAHANIMRGYEIADNKHAAIPLLHATVDPRTAKKQKELYQSLVKQLQTNGPDTKNPPDMRDNDSQNSRLGKNGISELGGDNPIIFSKSKKVNKKPIRPNPMRRHMSDRGGVPVDPTKNFPLEQASVSDSQIYPGAEFEAM
jgi:hypothetical protein